MKDPHNYRAVGWSMVAVAGALAAIGLLILALHDHPFFSDDMMKQKTKAFEDSKKQLSSIENETSKATTTKTGLAILLVYLK